MAGENHSQKETIQSDNDYWSEPQNNICPDCYFNSRHSIGDNPFAVGAEIIA